MFLDEEFSTEGCEEIPNIILEEAKHFVTFMSSMVEELIGNEEVMQYIYQFTNTTAAAIDYSSSSP